MGIKDKRKAAAHATAARLLAMKAQVKNPALNDVEILENNAEGSACEGGVMSEDSDCEYEGGVNCYWSDSDGGDYFKLDPEDFDGGDYSDTESLEEPEQFHCELNFIEFFWGAMKKYLRDNCDYTFAMLKENMPKALASRKYKSHRRIPDTVARALDAV